MNDNTLTTTTVSSSDNTTAVTEQDVYYMNKALEVAREALAIGEVPVGCVIVYDNENKILSHGANQVNATRDPTRHAEMVAMDRILTKGISSDQLKLPDSVLAAVQAAAAITSIQDVVDETHHDWKHAWQSNKKLYQIQDLAKCKLYVTCEPCIMCASALAHVGIGKVYFGCKNTKFGGCGSILQLHQGSSSYSTGGYPIVGGILEQEAIDLLRTFYARENVYAPEDKRKRKEPTDATITAAR